MELGEVDVIEGPIFTDSMAIWAQNRYIVCLLVTVILGNWSIILQGDSVKHTDHPQSDNLRVPETGCVITETRNHILAAIFIYSMIFDLIVLLLNTYKLSGARSGMLGTSRLAKMIFTDGLIYFILACVSSLDLGAPFLCVLTFSTFRFVANLLATVFMVLNLNQIMSVVFNVPAAVCTTVSGYIQNISS